MVSKVLFSICVLTEYQNQKQSAKDMTLNLFKLSLTPCLVIPAILTIA